MSKLYDEFPLDSNGVKMTLFTTGMWYDFFSSETLESSRAGTPPEYICRYYDGVGRPYDKKVTSLEEAQAINKRLNTFEIRHSDL